MNAPDPTNSPQADRRSRAPDPRAFVRPSRAPDLRAEVCPSRGLRSSAEWRRGPAAAVIAGLVLGIAWRGAPVAAASAPAAVRTGPVPGSYAWPVQGPVIRRFEPPASPYGAGHRGIDIAAPFGTEVHASNAGVVAFAGFVAGSLFVSIDHPDGVRTTYSYLSAVSVRRGAAVARGDPIGATGHGHPDLDRPHLHFGARIGDAYIDPMLLLGGGSLVGIIHLAPLQGSGSARPPEPSLL